MLVVCMVYVLVTTELQGCNTFTDRRPEGIEVTSLSPNRGSKLRTTIRIFQKVVQKGEVGAAFYEG